MGKTPRQHDESPGAIMTLALLFATLAATAPTPPPGSLVCEFKTGHLVFTAEELAQGALAAKEATLANGNHLNVTVSGLGVVAVDVTKPDGTLVLGHVGQLLLSNPNLTLKAEGAQLQCRGH